MNNEYKLKSLPSSPGVYLFTNNAGQIIYVGKAKNLKKRVSSYFNKKIGLAPDKLVMLSRISKIDHIITDTEAEALLLEANLIKKHKPQFNIILRDDKNFLYIKLNLTAEWPRLELVRQPQTAVNKSNKNNKRNKLINAIKASVSERNKSNKQNQFFGPYASSDSARHTYKIIARIFKICTCKNFTKRACLKYHLGWCLCPAETKISNSEYRAIFDKVAKFLPGQTTAVLRELKQEMKLASSKKDYEKAARLRDQIQAIEVTTAKQKIVSLKNENYDVVSLAHSGNLGAINLFTVREGKLINKLNFILEHTKNSTNAEIVESFIAQHYANSPDIPQEIIVPIKPPVTSDQLLVTSPTRGKKHQLVKLGEHNARDYLYQVVNPSTRLSSSPSLKAEDRISNNIIPLRGKQSNNKKVLSELKSVLRLPTLPIRIEAYDISNISGQNATGSLVVFTLGQPDKSQYRKFKIRAVKNVNDVAMMTEVVSRRLKHTDWPKPDLIVLDGGKPQLNAILKIDAIKLLIINYQLSIIALAKREEEIFLPNRSQPISLPKTSPPLQLLQRLRDEAHRFARGYYLKHQQKSSIHSALDDLPGLGPKTKKKLLQEFGSVKNIIKAPSEKIAKISNKKIAAKIKELSNLY